MAKFTLELNYGDDSYDFAEISVSGSPNKVVATLMMICRGTLMASTANRSTIYNDEGFEVCAYVQ